MASVVEKVRGHGGFWWDTRAFVIGYGLWIGYRKCNKRRQISEPIDYNKMNPFLIFILINFAFACDVYDDCRSCA